jgi:hypothetical protein
MLACFTMLFDATLLLSLPELCFLADYDPTKAAHQNRCDFTSLFFQRMQEEAQKAEGGSTTVTLL